MTAQKRETCEGEALVLWAGSCPNGASAAGEFPFCLYLEGFGVGEQLEQKHSSNALLAGASLCLLLRSERSHQPLHWKLAHLEHLCQGRALAAPCPVAGP